MISAMPVPSVPGSHPHGGDLDDLLVAQWQQREVGVEGAKTSG